MSETDRQLSIERILRDLAAGIEQIFPGMGFAVIMFDFGAPGVSNYISNAQRSDMITALRETADRIESNQDIPAVNSTTIQ